MGTKYYSYLPAQENSNRIDNRYLLAHLSSARGKLSLMPCLLKAVRASGFSNSFLHYRTVQKRSLLRATSSNYCCCSTTAAAAVVPLTAVLPFNSSSHVFSCLRKQLCRNAALSTKTIHPRFEKRKQRERKLGVESRYRQNDEIEIWNYLKVPAGVVSPIQVGKFTSFQPKIRISNSNFPQIPHHTLSMKKQSKLDQRQCNLYGFYYRLQYVYFLIVVLDVVCRAELFYESCLGLEA